MLRKSVTSWATVCRETGLSKGTAQRALHSLPKNDLRYVSAKGFGQLFGDPGVNSEWGLMAGERVTDRTS